ncbi:MAG: PCMD domain-containing protein [Bacteroides sp.]|nr:PCMD domain-containing protein [Bacteroides sp.]
MKKYISSLIIVLSLCISCSETDPFGEGTLNLVLKMGEVSVEGTTRTLPTNEELNSTCAIDIRNANGDLLQQYQGANTVPSELQMLTGSYSISATAGIKLDAAFDTPCYKGKVDFSIRKNEITTVNLPMSLQNTLVTIVYTKNAQDKFKSCKTNVSMSRGSLDFEIENPTAIGYFLLPTGETDLDYQVEAVTTDNIQKFYEKKAIPNIKPATKYTLTVDYQELAPTDGGAALTIEVEEEPQSELCTVVIARRPTIVRYSEAKEVSLSDPIFMSDDALEPVDIRVRTSSELQSLILDCDDVSKQVLGYATETLDLVTMGMNVSESIKDKLTYSNKYYQDETGSNGKSVATVSFLTPFFQKLTEKDGTYTITITATDKGYGKNANTPGYQPSKSWTEKFVIIVSNLVITTKKITLENVAPYSATLQANINANKRSSFDDHTIGFQYRIKNAENWITETVDADIKTKALSYRLNGLFPNTDYEYRAYSPNQDQGMIEICEFHTGNIEALPNGSFENWHNSSPALIYGAAETMFWDSGNHGSSTMGIDVTVYDESVTAPGNTGSRSIKMKSQFVGISIFGKFAAGNVFVGEYLKTDGTDGILGFGRKFTSRPIALKGYLRYEMHAISHSTLAEVPKGANDNAHIYVALGDWKKGTAVIKDSEAPVLIKTKDSERKLFDKNSNYVIAYGEHLEKESTLGSEMMPFEISIDYKDKTRLPQYIIVVASASRYGDYFTGGEGGTLWLDDLELVYE